jgi:hypothetical protein
VAANRAGAEDADSQEISPLRRRLPAYWLFFAGSLDGLEDELEPDGLDDELELDGLEDEPVAPLPEDDWSLELEPLEDEPEPLDDGGVALLLLPELDGLDGELIEPEAEPLLDGDDGDVAEPLEPGAERLDDAPLEPAPLEPRSQPAKAVPSATDTATARIESFMLPP